MKSILCVLYTLVSPHYSAFPFQPQACPTIHLLLPFPLCLLLCPMLSCTSFTSGPCVRPRTALLSCGLSSLGYGYLRFASCSYKSPVSWWNQWPSPADSIDEVPIPRLSHRTALVSCSGDAEVPLLRPGVSCLSSSPFPSIVSPQSTLQAGGRGRCPLGYASFRFAFSCSSLSAWETKKKETKIDHTCEGINYSQQPEACHMLKPQNMTTLFDVTQHGKSHVGFTRLLPSPCWMYEGEAETCMLPTTGTPLQA
jgi:hypothetical protein